jgi:hypothetical protein
MPNSRDSRLNSPDRSWLPDLNLIAENPSRIFPKFSGLCRQTRVSCLTKFQEGHVHTHVAIPLVSSLAKLSEAIPMLMARFWNNRDGGIAPMLAFMIIPLIGAVKQTAHADQQKSPATRAGLRRYS